MSFDISMQDAAAKEVLDLPFTTIAAIAAALSRPEISEKECIKKAYLLLEQSAAGQLYMASLQHKSIAAAVDYLSSYPEKPKFSEAEEIAFDSAKRFVHFDDEGEFVPVPFESALKFIIPKPGKATNRIPFFRKWIMDRQHCSLIEAAEKIATWRKEGIPTDVFFDAVDSYPQWRQNRTSKERSEARKAGLAKRQKSKRKARPPIHKVTTEMISAMREIQSEALKKKKAS